VGHTAVGSPLVLNLLGAASDEDVLAELGDTGLGHGQLLDGDSVLRVHLEGVLELDDQLVALNVAGEGRVEG